MKDSPINDSINVRSQLDGWELAWLRLGRGSNDDAALGALREATAERARAELDLAGLGSHPAVAAMRRLFKTAGCDPSRYRPSSEALLRRVLKGDELPAIHPFVDLNNCLSVSLAVPCCVMPAGTFSSPVVLRSGRDDEHFESLRGPFKLAGKPLLADAGGPFGTPVTDSQRVKVRPETDDAWMVAYLPAGVVASAAVRTTLERLLGEAPVAVITS